MINIVINDTVHVVQYMWYLIGFGTYDSEGMKLQHVDISPKYSTTLQFKADCHGYFILLDICHWGYKV